MGRIADKRIIIRIPSGCRQSVGSYLKAKATASVGRCTKRNAMTTKAQDSKPTPFTSRRSGFDRRWIHSANHRPERRRGKERRKIGRQDTPKTLAPNGEDGGRVTFPELKTDKNTPSANPNALPLVENCPSGIAETPVKGKTPDDD